MLRTARPFSALLVLVCATATHAATFTVTNTNDAGAGSFRQALLDANANAGADTIQFNIPGAGVHTIQPATPFAPITGPVTIDGYSQPGASANTLPVGTDAVLLVEIDGTPGSGLELQSNASGSTVRGLVLHHFTIGIYLAGADNCLIEGNYIGTDPTGMLFRGNSRGILLAGGAQSNVIGGNTPSARNVVAGSSTSDIELSSSTTLGNTFLGNYVGIAASGVAGIPGSVGFALNLTGPNTVGGAGAGANYIGGHTTGNAIGIRILNATTGIQVLGNNIGLGADNSTPIANGTGIRIESGLAGTPNTITIGTAAAPNTIAHSSQDGIWVMRGLIPHIQGVTIGPNSIHDNGQLGIDIDTDGVTTNDTLDGDSGANGRQNFPVVTSAHALGGSLTVSGTLHSTPFNTFTVRIYANAACDPSGNGEGETWLVTAATQTDAAGNAAFHATISSGITSGFITATATNDASQNTSEFSPCQPVSVVALPTATIGDVSVVEGNAGTTNATFTVYLSAAPPAGVAISWVTADGTATTADNDYVAASGTAVFAAGQTSQTITVTINGDGNIEPDQTFFVNLTLAVNATVGDNTAVGTIIADDSVPTISVAGASTPEGDAGTTALQFTVTVSPVPLFDVTVSYTTIDGAAVSPNDYAAAGGTVTVPAGSPSGTFSVTINGDTMHELDDMFSVQLYDPSNGQLGQDAANATITNDDPVPTVTINDPSANEGNAGTSPLTFTATLSNPSYLTVSVPFTVTGGSATVASDFAPQFGSFTFLSPATTNQISVMMIGDTTPEPDETVIFDLTSATNATIADNQGIGTIVNDDGAAPAPDLAITKSAPASVVFGQTFPYTITVTNNGNGTATNVTVTDVLPAEVNFVSATTTQGSCSGTTTVTCNLGTLAPAASATVTISVETANTGTIANTASVAATETDSDTTNNSDAALVTAARAAIAAVPTLSQWALIALLAALAGFAVRRM